MHISFFNYVIHGLLFAQNCYFVSIISFTKQQKNSNPQFCNKNSDAMSL